jgi:hypothetical protein
MIALPRIQHSQSHKEEEEEEEEDLFVFNDTIEGPRRLRRERSFIEVEERGQQHTRETSVHKGAHVLSGRPRWQRSVADRGPPATLEFWVVCSIPKREEPGKTGAPCVKVPGSSRVPASLWVGSRSPDGWDQILYRPGGWVLHQPPWSFGFDSQTRGTRENRRTLY